MSQAVLSPNLTKEVQWEVSQIADERFPHMIVQGGLSVILNHLKILKKLQLITEILAKTCIIAHHNMAPNHDK